MEKLIEYLNETIRNSYNKTARDHNAIISIEESAKMVKMYKLLQNSKKLMLNIDISKSDSTKASYENWNEEYEKLIR